MDQLQQRRLTQITYCSRRLAAESEGREQLFSILTEAGYSVKQMDDGHGEPANCNILWIQGNANWFPKTCRSLVQRASSKRPFTLIWHSEPLPMPRSAGLPAPKLSLRELVKILLRDRRATDIYTNASRLRRLANQGLPDLLVVSTLNRQEFLAEQGIPSHWVPLGYHPSRSGKWLGLNRDIDVLFLGTMNVPRRRRIVRHLRQRGMPVETRGDWFDPNCWGEPRTQLLNRTRILLNLQRYPGELSGSRLILGMANKALVISEPICLPAPYIPGKHFIEAKVDEMPEVIHHYLAHPEACEPVIEEGFRLVTQEVTLERSVAKILHLIDGKAGALDERDGSSKLLALGLKPRHNR